MLTDSRVSPDEEGAAYDGAGADQQAFAQKIDHRIRADDIIRDPSAYLNKNVELVCQVASVIGGGKILSQCGAANGSFVVEAVAKQLYAVGSTFHIYGHVEPVYYLDSNDARPEIYADYFLPLH